MADNSPSRRPPVADHRAAIDWPAALHEHAGWLRKVIRVRLGESDAVDDVMQNVALAAADDRLRPRQIENAAPWLYRVAIRQCLLHRRKSGRRRRLVNDYAVTSSSWENGDGDPLEWLLGQERREAVRAALRSLPDIDRQLLVLKHTEHWTYRQLADHLGVSLHTIEYRLLQARKRLRRELLVTSVVEAGA